MCECSATADRRLSDRPAALKRRIPFNRMQSFSAGTHDAFPRLLWQPAGHRMPEANERQFGLLFICAGWFHPNHPARTACKKPRRRLLFNAAIGGPRKIRVFRFRWLVNSRAFLGRIHSNIRTVKPVEQCLTAVSKIPNSEIAPQAGKIGASASGPPVGRRASDGIKPSGHCSRSHSTLRGANVPRGDTCASEEHWRKS